MLQTHSDLTFCTRKKIGKQSDGLDYEKGQLPAIKGKDVLIKFRETMKKYKQARRPTILAAILTTVNNKPSSNCFKMKIGNRK
jgi:hypothetical protein